MKAHISFEEFKKIMAEELGFEEKYLTEDTSFLDDLGVDSLSLINFIIKLEKRYGIRMQMESIFCLKNIREAYELFTAKMEAAQSSLKDAG